MKQRETSHRFRRWIESIPGLIVVITVAWLSFTLSELLGTRLLGMSKSPVSPVMVAIVLGMLARNTIKLPAWLSPGIRLAVKKVLRLGIVLLGLRLSVFEVFRLGAMGVPVVVLCILAALFVSALLGRAMSLPNRLVTLIAVGTSICGVSAIVATGPAIDASDDETAYAVSVITIFGLVATALYPLLAHALFRGDSMMVGMFLGTSIHDTSQVTAAGLLYSDLYGDLNVLNFAVVSKLTRNVFMALVVPVMALRYARLAGVGGRENGGENLSSSAKKFSGRGNWIKSKVQVVLRYFPTFILGFVALAVLRSLLDLAVYSESGVALSAVRWNHFLSVVQVWAVRLLVAALAAVGLQTSFRNLKMLGMRPFLVGLVTAVAVGLVSAAGILLMVS